MALLTKKFYTPRNAGGGSVSRCATRRDALHLPCLNTQTLTKGAESSHRDLAGHSICFAAGTNIATPLGPRRIEDLSIGDLVQTQDRGAQPVLWVGGASQLTAGHGGQVHLAAGVLGAARDMLVHCQQLILFRDAAAELLFGDAEVLIAAQDLLGLPGVTQDRLPRITRYFHLLLPQHYLVCADGVVSESMQPNAVALDGLSTRALADLRRTVPEQQMAHLCLQPAARRILMPHQARVLLAMLHQGDASSRIEVLLGLVS
jgi:hypothetical protein